MTITPNPTHSVRELVNCPYCGEPEYVFGFETVISSENEYNQNDHDFIMVQRKQCANCERSYLIKSKLKLVERIAEVESES